MSSEENSFHTESTAFSTNLNDDQISIIKTATPIIMSANRNQDKYNNVPGNDQSYPTRLPQHLQVRVSKIRYFLLIIFILLSMSNSFQWIEYPIIESIIKEYYNISTFWVNCTSVVYMFFYVIGIIPATYILDRYGLRFSLILGSFGNALGSCIKLLSFDRSRFWVAMIGQTITGASQLFILNIPPILAATWFAANEVTRVTSYGVFGNQVGIALGFVIPPQLMPDFENATSGANLSPIDISEVRQGLIYLISSVAAITTVIFLLIFLFFKNEPKYPPSPAQLIKRHAQEQKPRESYWSSIKSLYNLNFILLFISYGLNTGVFYALSTVLSQLITHSIGQKYIRDAGFMGLLIVLSGIFGSVICGYVLSWTQKYKLICVSLYSCSLLGVAFFAIGLYYESLQFIYFACIVLGFFMTGYLPIGFEYAAEISYPVSEGLSAGLLNASAQIFGMAFTFLSTVLITKFGTLWTNLGYMVTLAIGLVLTIMTKSDLRRQATNDCSTTEFQDPQQQRALI